MSASDELVGVLKVHGIPSDAELLLVVKETNHFIAPDGTKGKSEVKRIKRVPVLSLVDTLAPFFKGQKKEKP